MPVIEGGVPLRTMSTCHDTASRSEMAVASASVGTSGIDVNLVKEVTASARSLLSLISGSDAPALVTAVCTCPAETSAIDCGLLR